MSNGLTNDWRKVEDLTAETGLTVAEYEALSDNGVAYRKEDFGPHTGFQTVVCFRTMPDEGVP